MSKPVVWLNSGCLGPRNSEEGHLNTADASATLLASYRACSQWVADWCGVERERVLLTTGATDSCDIALTTRYGSPTALLHTNLAHECTKSSVTCAAAFIGELIGKRIPVVEIAINDLFERPPRDFAAELARRVSGACGEEKAGLVLEHVTSDDGFVLPLDDICEHLGSMSPRVDIVLDGAQASGVWRPPTTFSGAYVGCFHKYVDGPAGTGFCVLPIGLARYALHRARATQSWGDADIGEHLPTTDVLKWSACRDAIEALDARAHLTSGYQLSSRLGRNCSRWYQASTRRIFPA